MSSNHPPAHPGAHHPRAPHQPQAQREHPYAHHRAHEQRPRPRSRFKRTLSQLVRLFFRNRRGRLSPLKFCALAILLLAGGYLSLIRGWIPVDVASPWIIRALEEQLGPGYKIEIRRTHFDQDNSGSTVLHVNRIRLRGPDGKVIATAPNAEVGFEGGSILMGNLRARRIDLVGAETTVRIDAEGRISIFTGSDAVPIAANVAPAALPKTSTKAPAKSGPARPTPEPFHYPELIRWLVGLEKNGLDGVALAEIGLKQGTLVVESAVTGRKWTFRNINIHLARPADGGLLFTLASSGSQKPWNLTATVGPVKDGVRAIDIVARDLAPGDLLLAAGVSESNLLAETPLSGILRAQIAEDGRLLSANVRASAGSGTLGSVAEPEARFSLDNAQLQLRFDPERKAIIADTFLVQAGANRIALSAVIEAPKGNNPVWPVSIPQGLLFLSTGHEGEAPLVLDRVAIRGAYDPALQRLVIVQGNLAGSATGGAFSGSVTFGPQPTLVFGLAASRMPASAAKRLWPALIAPGTRGWAMERIEQGTIERVVVALNIPLEAIGKPNADLPDEAVRFEMSATGASFRPAANLPLIRDADATVVVTGRTARVRIGKAITDTPSGRRISISEGTLEVGNHIPPNPNGTIRFRFDGQADAIAEMASIDMLKGAAGFTVDPATAKGSVSAKLRLDLVFRRPIREDEVDYAVEGEVTGFAADRIIRGQRVDGVNAKLSLTPAIMTIKGEGRIAGATASFDYKKSKAKAEAEFRISTTFDDSTRSRFGIDLVPWLTGPVGIRAQGRITDRETRVDVENDLTAAKVSDLVPGWSKPAGKSAKATYRLIERENGLRLEDLNVSGGGTLFKGTLELDGEGGFVSVNLPVFHLSDGDKANLRAERTADGIFKVTVRGDVLDARGAIRGLTEGSTTPGAHGRPYRGRDLDLDLRLGVVTGNNGEVARQIELRLLRRNGEVRSFALLGKIGRDASLVGELRARDGGRPVIYVTSGDAGALLRFTDTYNRIQGGDIWIMIDPPNSEGAPQEGIINIREFAIQGEPSLDRLSAMGPAEGADLRGAPRPTAANSVSFIRLQIAFSRMPGKFVIREGVIFGPTIGATVDGTLDYAANMVQVRGTYIPAFGLNNLFGQLPIVGMFLGGPREGLLAITFEIVGPASGPTLRVNPMSAAAPGFLRKLFEFRGTSDAPTASPFDRQ